MAFGPNLFSGQQHENSSELVSPPEIIFDELEVSEPSFAEDIAKLANNSQPSKGIQLNQFMLSPNSEFVARNGEFVMPNNNPESFLRQGGLIVDGPHIYIDSIEQSQVPSANLRGALMRMVQSGVSSVNVRTFTKDRVVDSKELIRRRFRLL